MNKLGIMYRNVILTTKPFYDSIIESNSDSVVISVKYFNVLKLFSKTRDKDVLSNFVLKYTSLLINFMIQCIYKIKRMFIIIADQCKSGRVSTLNQLKCIQCILIEDSKKVFSLFNTVRIS